MTPLTYKRINKLINKRNNKIEREYKEIQLTLKQIKLPNIISNINRKQKQ